MTREKRKTSVDLTPAAQTIKDELCPIFGLKNILSAGLILLNELSADKQKQVIARVNAIPKLDPNDLYDKIKDLAVGGHNCGILLPDNQLQSLIDQLRISLGPEKKEASQTKKA